MLHLKLKGLLLIWNFIFTALLEHQEGGVDFEVAFSQLATCTAGKHVRKSRVRKLLDIISDQRSIHSVGE